MRQSPRNAKCVGIQREAANKKEQLAPSFFHHIGVFGVRTQIRRAFGHSMGAVQGTAAKLVSDPNNPLYRE